MRCPEYSILEESSQLEGKGLRQISLFVCNVANEEIDREGDGNLRGPLEYLL
jgi:hypothetical protein